MPGGKEVRVDLDSLVWGLWIEWASMERTLRGWSKIKSRVTRQDFHAGRSGSNIRIVQMMNRRKQGYSVFPARISIPIVKSG